MTKADDVAAYILKAKRGMSGMKLQKLLYYSQAWHMVWSDGEPLFPERIEAWANGPVVRSIYAQHRLEIGVSEWPSGNPDNLTRDEAEHIDIVLGFYGDRPAHELSELTHREDPWLNARQGLPPGTRSTVEITPQSMYEYYDGLTGTAT